MAFYFLNLIFNYLIFFKKIRKINKKSLFLLNFSKYSLKIEFLILIYIKKIIIKFTFLTIDQKNNIIYNEHMNINTNEQEYTPKQSEINGVLLEHIKLSRQIILEKVLKANLSKSEKNQVVAYLDNLKFFPLSNNYRRAAAFYDIHGDSGNYIPNSIYLKEDLGEKQFPVLNHEMFHAASSAFSEYSGFLQTKELANPNQNEDEAVFSVFTKGLPKTKTVMINRGITEAMTTMYSDAVYNLNGSYQFPAKVLSVLCDGLDENEIFTFYIKADLKGLENAIARKYGLENTSLVHEIFGLFDSFADSTETKNKTIFVNRQRCVAGVGANIAKKYAQILTQKAIKEGLTSPNVVYETAISNLELDQNFNNYFAYARDESGEKIDLTQNKELANDLIDLRLELKENLKNQIQNDFMSKVDVNSISFDNPISFNDQKIVESFAAAVLMVQSCAVPVKTNAASKE